MSVGRVGALAVALGVGVGIGFGQGMALADDGSGSSTASAGSAADTASGAADSGAPEAQKPTSTASNAVTAGTPIAESTVPSGASSSPATSSATASGESTVTAASPGTAYSTGGAHSSATDTTQPISEPASTTAASTSADTLAPSVATGTGSHPSAPTTAPDALGPATAQPISVQPQRGASSTAAANSTTPAPATSSVTVTANSGTPLAGSNAAPVLHDALAVAAIVDPTPSAADASSPTFTGDVAAATSRSSAATPAAAITPAIPTDPFTVVTHAVVGAVQTVLTLFTGNAPAAPDNPFAWALMAVARRGFWFNQAPVLTYNPANNTVNGLVVTGTIVATDADGDPLTLTHVGDPSKGTVVISDPVVDPVTGAYTYTFTYTASGASLQSDDFNFVVDDSVNNPHFNGPLDVIGQLPLIGPLVPSITNIANSLVYGSLPPSSNDAVARQIVIFPSGAVNPSTGLSTTGKWITDEQGRVVILHGVNVVNKVAPYTYDAAEFEFDEEDADFLKANGFNVVRLGVNWAAVEPAPGVYDDAYLEQLDETIKMLEERDIYVIVDWHQDSYGTAFNGEGAPEWATQTGGLPNVNAIPFPVQYFVNPAQWRAWDGFWQNSAAPDGVGLQDHYANAQLHVANYLGDNPNVMSYEIINEPFSGSAWSVCLALCPGFNLGTMPAFYNKVTSAIRAVDPDTPIIITPEVIAGNGGTPIILGPVSDPHTILAYHNYFSLISPLVAFFPQFYADGNNIPALMTEFGTPALSSVGLGIPALEASKASADQHFDGWTMWNYTGVNDITTFGDPNAEAVVFDPTKPPEGDNVNMPVLEALVDPYPQAVSGTPLGYSVDDNGTFRFNYSTARVDGTGNFDPGSQTSIAMPALRYPNGYQVAVTGGHVVSAPNAPNLLIASDGADPISVVVTPSTVAASTLTPIADAS